MSLAARTALLGLVLFCEKFALNFLVDFNAAQSATGLGALVRVVQHGAFRFAVAFAVSLALFAYARDDARWVDINSAARGVTLRTSRLALHVALVLLLAPLSFFLYGHGTALPFALVAVLWMVLAAAAVWALFTALAPWALWSLAARTLGALWLYAALAAAVAASAMQWSQSLWAPTAAMTFDLVWHVLSPFIPSLHANPSTLILSSSHFSIQVSEVCSGLEGAGLLLAFCFAWLLCFRKEYIFPRALVLLPAGLALSFSLNVVRIAALMWIGYAGFPQVAVYGFHSQAGWIAFNCAAGLIAIASRRSRWLNRSAAGAAGQIDSAAPLAARAGAGGVKRVQQTDAVPAVTSRAENPTASYLLPFLLMLAAGMVARAVSSGFEKLYVLRLVCVVGALIGCWPRLRTLNWRCSWRGPLAGAVIFGVWIAVAALVTVRADMPAALAGLSAPLRTAWLVARVAAALITVPIAEELAFRGYLMRRIVAADFESVRFRDVGATALILSALAFGVEHASLWLPGVLAGLIYGVVLIRTERMGEAVAAHATTNGLLAVYVLHWSQWQLW